MLDLPSAVVYPAYYVREVVYIVIRDHCSREKDYRGMEIERKPNIDEYVLQ